ncbi:outer capsid protein VP2 [Bluetongue virus]|uniref:Outer capsid protein VP2 n=3 Tax=Bluetongue virus TaxID=40051 RepID=D8V894_BTV|nr:outer capsid protein VP2 [Bluetongue virus]QIQ51072.1 VP2 [Bluetongue virus 6]ADI49499.1 outer capsid protein VP2 [Bluetongue virus]ADI49532.1 outer capsid protein VP2 [Bluetongue virus]ADI49552.1 outer capsid protein VP2 [Bluetongue virus]
MDELAIPIINGHFPKEALIEYDCIVELNAPSEDDEVDVTQIPTKNMMDIPDVPIREALRVLPQRNDGHVLTRILDISLSGYDRRKYYKTNKGGEFESPKEWLNWMIHDSMDVQPLKVSLEMRSTVKHELFSSNVYLSVKKADTSSYHIEAIGDTGKACDHSYVSMWNNLVRHEVMHCAQESAYVLKPTMEIIVHSERASTDVPFQLVGQNYVSIGRNHRLVLGDEPYKKTLQGLTKLRVQGKVPPQIQDEIQQLNRIRDAWIGDAYNPRHIRSLELCRILSSVGRKVVCIEEEPKNESDISVKFQFKLDEKFRLNDGERGVIFTSKNQRNDQDRFFVLIMIAASDTYNGRIWWTNPYPCLRGALIASETRLGDVYWTLRHTYDWSVRMTYSPRMKEREDDKYIYGRVNLFDLDASPGDKVVHWRYELISQTKKTTFHDGNPCDLFPDVEGIVTKFNKTAYSNMINELLNGGWNTREFKMYKLLEDEGNVLTIDFEKDTKLNSRSEFILPNYYDKWIYAPMFNAKLKITETEIAQAKNDDPYVIRTLAPIGSNPFTLQRLCLGNYYDVRPAMHGRALSKKQEQSAYHAALVKEKDYEDILTRRGLRKADKPCPLTTCAYILERTALLWIDVMEKHISEVTDDSNEFDFPKACVDSPVGTDRIVDVTQLIVLLIDWIYERRKDVRSVDESRWVIETIRRARGRNRLELISREFPNFGRAVARLQSPNTVGDVMVINFLPFLFLMGDNVSYEHRQWSVPVILHADVMWFIPVEVGAFYNRFGVTSFLEYLMFFPSFHMRTVRLDEAEVKVSKLILDFYLDTTIFSGGIQSSVVSTKQILYETYLSSLCGGFSEGLVWYLPITHPTKCVVAIEFADNKVSAVYRCNRLRARFPLSSIHLRGIAILTIGKNRMVDAYTEGIVSHRICKKNVLGYTCQILLLKFSGHVFGNDEMLTKLLNV